MTMIMCVDVMAMIIGDSHIILWDVERMVARQTFSEASMADIMCVRPCPTNPSLLLSGSCNTDAHVWDIRLIPYPYIHSFFLNVC
jgi:hypothetical protein